MSDLPAVLGEVARLNLPWWIAERDSAAASPADSVAVNSAYPRGWQALP